jgi:hypothetical protein
MEKDNKKKEKARKIEHLGLHEDGFWVWGNGILDIHGEMFLPDCLGNVCVDGKLYNLPWCRREELDIVPEDGFCPRLNWGDLSTWSSMMLTTYYDRGIVAVGYALAAIFKDLCDELAMRFPILYICGRKGNGKTRLASSLMALMGRPQKGPDLPNMTKGYMNRWLGLMKNGYVHIDEYRNDERESLISMLRRAPEERDCGVILCGQERDLGCSELNKSSIILYSNKDRFSTIEEHAMNALRAYEYLGLTGITNRLQGYRSREFAAKIEECYWFLYRSYIPRFIDIREIDTDMLRCWCLVPAVCLALRESGAELAWEHSRGMSVFMDLLVEQARWINGINGGDGVNGGE